MFKKSGRRLLLVAILLAVGQRGLAAQENAGPTNQPFNVLFIAIDDLRTELGCYGHDYVQSPNLDRFARRSVLFRNHFVQVATCGASRFALLTGRSPKSSGVTGGNAALYSGPTRLESNPDQGASSLPELFRLNGYHTTCIGKVSHTPDGRVYAYNGNGDGRDELPNAWDDKPTPFGPWKRGWGTFFAYANGKHREDGQGHRDLMEFVVDSDRDLPDGLMADTAIEKLRELKRHEKPFFMGLGFFKPHLPFVAPRQDWEAMADVDIPAPPQPEKISSPYWHGSGEFYKYRMTFEKSKPLAARDALQARRAYLACVRYVDRQVGRVLQALEDEGLADSTIVVVWGDHGWHLGDSAIWGKHSPFERAVHSTLMIHAPRAVQNGSVSDELVQTTDLFPTLIDLCDLKNRSTQFPLDGQSLRPLLEDSGASWRDFSVSYWNRAVSVRTKTHRFIAKVVDGKATDQELYDLRASDDPQENLVSSDKVLASALTKIALAQAPADKSAKKPKDKKSGSN